MAVSKSLRFTVLSRDGFMCVYCHTTEKPIEVDHVRPIALGGSDNPENLVAACSDCNGGKSAGHLANLDDFPRPTLMHDSAYIAKLEGQISKLKNDLNAESERLKVIEGRLKATAKLATSLQRINDESIPKTLHNELLKIARSSPPKAVGKPWERVSNELAKILNHYEQIMHDNNIQISKEWRDQAMSSVGELIR